MPAPTERDLAQEIANATGQGINGARQFVASLTLDERAALERVPPRQPRELSIAVQAILDARANAEAKRLADAEAAKKAAEAAQQSDSESADDPDHQ